MNDCVTHTLIVGWSCAVHTRWRHMIAYMILIGPNQSIGHLWFGKIPFAFRVPMFNHRVGPSALVGNSRPECWQFTVSIPEIPSIAHRVVADWSIEITKRWQHTINLLTNLSKMCIIEFNRNTKFSIRFNSGVFFFFCFGSETHNSLDATATVYTMFIRRKC